MSGRKTVITLMALLGLLAAQEAATQERPLIVIDPGHGGDELGVGYEDLVEKDLVLQIGFAIGAELVGAGFDVAYTRTQDEPVEWADRRRIAEDAGARALLMLHVNGSEDLTEHGAEIYVNVDDPSSSSLADAIGEALMESGSAAVVEARDWPFLQSTTVATAMIELAFMTHPVERRLLRQASFHHELGQAFVEALRSWSN